MSCFETVDVSAVSCTFFHNSFLSSWQGPLLCVFDMAIRRSIVMLGTISAMRTIIEVGLVNNAQHQGALQGESLAASANVRDVAKARDTWRRTVQPTSVNLSITAKVGAAGKREANTALWSWSKWKPRKCTQHPSMQTPINHLQARLSCPTTAPERSIENRLPLKAAPSRAPTSMGGFASASNAFSTMVACLHTCIYPADSPLDVRPLWATTPPWHCTEMS